jgi:hypothetical protein
MSVLLPMIMDSDVKCEDPFVVVKNSFDVVPAKGLVV